MLSLVVRKERRDLAELGERLVQQQNGFKIKMKELEDNILFKLATAQVRPGRRHRGLPL
jgi:dynein heavy chain